MPNPKNKTGKRKHSKIETIRETRRIISYGDLNAHGALFGGRLAMWIDEAAAIYALCRMGTKRIVTLRISELLFKKPIRLHDVLEFKCGTLKEGRTSLAVECRVVLMFTKREIEVARAEVVFVAVNERGNSMPWKKQEKNSTL